MQATWAEMATEVWNDDWINIKNEISSNGKLLPSRYSPGNFIESRPERHKCFLEWVENFYLTEYITCINWKGKGTLIKLVLSNLVDVIEDIKAGYYTRNSGYDFIVKGGKKSWMSAATQVESSIYVMPRWTVNSKTGLKSCGAMVGGDGKNLHT